jgi:hypothetical protein
VGGSGDGALAEAWDGQVWTLQSVPNASGAPTPIYLNGVSCPAAGACIAVGTEDGPSLTFGERWNGISWTADATIQGRLGTADSLAGVSCTSGLACIAVGQYVSDNDAFYQALIERRS